MSELFLSRRQAVAALSASAAYPLISACSKAVAPETALAPPATVAPAPNASAILDSIAENLLRLSPESATSLGIDKGEHAALRSQLADRSAAGQQRVAETIRADLARVNAIDTAALDHSTRTSVEVVKSAYTTALEGFALPYGDVAVGGWRNTPYVVIQNVGAYLDVPRFLDSEHQINDAADAEAYLSRLQTYPRQLDGELARVAAARAKGLVPPDFLLDKALGQMKQSVDGARKGGGLVESLERRTREKNIPGNWAERARAIVQQDVVPALERQIAELTAQRAQAKSAPGMWAQPGGDDYYAWALKASTTTTMSPDEVHQMGLNELRELQGRMDPILQEPRLHQGLGRRAHAGAGQGPALQILGRRQGPRRDHGLHPGTRRASSAPSFRRCSTRW